MEPVQIFAIIIFALIGDAMFVAAWGTFMDSQGVEFCNPCWLYKEKKLCIFSCVFVTVFANITVLPYALGYWFYKACTTRRKK